MENYIQIDNPGMDQIDVELIKFSAEVVSEKIADNNIAATGKQPNKITRGSLRALEKPRKSKRPT